MAEVGRERTKAVNKAQLSLEVDAPLICILPAFEWVPGVSLKIDRSYFFPNAGVSGACPTILAAAVKTVSLIVLRLVLLFGKDHGLIKPKT